MVDVDSSSASGADRRIGRRGLLLAAAGGAVSTTVVGAILAAPAPASAHGTMAQRAPFGSPRGNKDFRVSDHDGGVRSGAAVRAAVAAAVAWTAGSSVNRARVLFEPATYRIEDDGTPAWYGIELTNTRNIELVGGGAELLFLTPHKGAIAVTRSTGIVIRGLTIDYETPPFIQAVVRAVDAASATVEIEPLPGFPSLADRELFPGAGYLTLHDAVTGRFKRAVQSTFSISYGDTPSGPDRWTVTIDAAHRGRIIDIAVGDGVATGYRGARNAIALHQASGVVLSGLTIHAGPGAGVISNNSESTVLRDSVIDVRPGSGRWISVNADAYHHHGGRIGPTVTGNRFGRTHDDGINVYVQMRPVLGVSADGRTLELGGGSAEVAAGDLLQLVESVEGRVRGEGRVSAVVGDVRNAGPITVTLSSAVEGVALGDAAFNRSYCGSGFVISGNTMQEMRGLGVRMKASNGVITGNTISDMTNWGIWVANDAGYHEGPVGSENLVINRNVIRRVCLDQTLVPWPHCAAAIMLEHFTVNYTAGVTRAHRNITISDNEVEDPPRFAVYLGAGKNVTVSRTTVTVTVNNPRSGDPSAILGVDNLANSMVVNMSINDAQTPPRPSLWQGSGVSGLSLFRIDGL